MSTPHRHAVIMDAIACAIINGTATVLDTGPAIYIEGRCREGKMFSVCTLPDGRMHLSRDEGGSSMADLDELPIPE